MNENGRNTMLDGLAEVISHVSLHDGFPGAGGVNEITGGGPAYERSSVLWEAADNGVLSSSGQPSFNIPAGATISWCGFWDNETGGAFYGSVPLGSGVPVLVSGAMGSDVVTAINHPFTDGRSVTFIDTLGSLPGGLTEGNTYWVRDATTDTFKVSATESGAAIDLLTSGVALAYAIVEETYNQQGIHTFTSLDVVIS